MIDRPDVVVKFDWIFAMKHIVENSERHLPLDALDDHQYATLLNDLREEEKVYNVFKKYFGLHALVQKSFLIKVPYRKLDT